MTARKHSMHGAETSVGRFGLQPKSVCAFGAKLRLPSTLASRHSGCNVFRVRAAINNPERNNCPTHRDCRCVGYISRRRGRASLATWFRFELQRKRPGGRAGKPRLQPTEGRASSLSIPLRIPLDVIHMWSQGELRARVRACAMSASGPWHVSVFRCTLYASARLPFLLSGNDSRHQYP